MPKHQDLKGPFSEYRKRRLPGATPEPFDDTETPFPGGPRRFVVQLHAARNLHYDLRLEIAGALHSWALPKGIPTTALDPRRGAFETEDHPLAYADFEGVIPPGNYGAGAMIVWDRGELVPLEDLAAGLGTGKLLFELKGYKLRGLWTLVRTKEARAWLLIKKPPGWAARNGYGERLEATPAAPGEESILAGLTVHELALGGGRAAAARRRAEELGAPRRRVEAGAVEVMAPEAAAAPFSDPRYLFELKYDGFRMIAARQASASGGPPRPALYLRSRREATETFPDLARALAALPVQAVLDGEAVVLDDEGLPSPARLQRRAHLSGRREVERAALELPATLYLFDLLAVEGHDLRPLPLSERKAILKDILPKAGPLRFADGVVGAGEALFREVARRGLEGLVAKRLDSPYRSGRSTAWRKLRVDRIGGTEPEPALAEPVLSQPRTARPRHAAAPPLSNPEKVLWPDEGYTKGDLAAFYRAVAPRLLPYLHDRPLVVDRYPDGILGKSFYQKNAPDLPGVRTAPVWTVESSREIRYLLVDDEAGLAAVANLAAIPLHVWSSRVTDLERPDWAILDLDPKGAPFAGAVSIARALRALCAELGLPAYVKTSGGSGLHVLLPLGGRCGHEPARQLAELLARLVAAELPEVATVERARAARGGKVYVDYLQNGRGKLLAAPYSVRPLPGAPVSTPLAWREVAPGLDPKAFTIATVPARLKKQRRDPLAPVLGEAPDLSDVLTRLARRMGSAGY